LRRRLDGGGVHAHAVDSSLAALQRQTGASDAESLLKRASAIDRLMTRLQFETAAQRDWQAPQLDTTQQATTCRTICTPSRPSGPGGAPTWRDIDWMGPTASSVRQGRGVCAVVNSDILAGVSF
jgi:hypothetical protein